MASMRLSSVKQQATSLLSIMALVVYHCSNTQPRYDVHTDVQLTFLCVSDGTDACEREFNTISFHHWRLLRCQCAVKMHSKSVLRKTLIMRNTLRA